jgi:cell division septum initiation protein DivIVA
MAELDTRKPEFTVGIRGYDRAQVDEYVEHLTRLVADAEQRARDAEAEYEFDEHAAVGPRIAQIFALAEAEARELRDRVSTQFSGLVDEARTKARAIIEAAERAADEITERAEREHAAMLTEFDADRKRIRDEVTILELRKAEAIGELNRLRELLGEAAGVVGPAAESGGTRIAVPTQTIGPGDETIELPAIVDDTDAR